MDIGSSNIWLENAIIPLLALSCRDPARPQALAGQISAKTSTANHSKGTTMEKWITRSVAVLCAGGSTALFWVFGAFLALPWRENRLFALNNAELQVLGVSLIVGLAVAWGALHVLALVDRASNPWVYRAGAALLLAVSLAAVFGGMAWTSARIA